MLFKLLHAGQASPEFDQQVLCLGKPDRLSPIFAEAGIKVEHLGMDLKRPNPWVIWRFVQCIRQARPDIVVSWLFVADFLTLLTRPWTGIPRLICNLRTSSLSLKSLGGLDYILVRLNRFLSSRMDGMLHNAHAGKQQLQQLGYTPSWWHYIANGFDLEKLQPNPHAPRRLREQLKLPEGAFLFGCFARYHPCKDHKSLLHAFQWLHQRQPHAYLLLVGRGLDCAEMDQLVDRLQVQDHVLRLAELTDVGQWLPGLDAAVLASSEGEGFSNFIGEAMACGVPCVSTDSGDHRLVIGDTGSIVPAGDAHALGEAMQRMLLLSPPERQALGVRAREQIVGHFDIDQVVTAYHLCYQALMAGSPPETNQPPKES